MTLTHQKFVYARFDALEARFRTDVADSDVRVTSVLAALAPLSGKHLLDLGCGKGRFARHFRERGARVVGLDPSRGMLNHASAMPRVQGSALRLPFADASFDAVVAIEVFEHLPTHSVDAAIAETFRVLRPGGTLAIVDKNVLSLNARRPYLPSVFVKWIDQARGRWMYAPGDPVREIWFRPEAMRRRLERDFRQAAVTHLLSENESNNRVHRFLPAARLMTLWTATKPGGAPHA